jgi:RNA polymerase sigma-70 factor, ECF subfamily
MPPRTASTVDSAPAARLERELTERRRELTGYCYRMLGSGFEAEDAVQETMIRAWKAIDRFEGRSSLRSWLYRIATNVCLDHLNGRQRRARPMDLGPASVADATLSPGLGEESWVLPIADAKVVPDAGDPAEVAAARDSIRLAFVTALQTLPARQRAVLILREVLRWQATEVAELLDTSVASVNSALQRARATLAATDPEATKPTVVDPDQQAMLSRYVDAFERYDIPALVALLREDATMSMPPFELWLHDRDEIGKWHLGKGAACEGSRVLPAGMVNGRPAFGQYKIDPAGGFAPWSLQVLDVAGGEIVQISHFLYADLFPFVGLPAHLD